MAADQQQEMVNAGPVGHDEAEQEQGGLGLTGLTLSLRSVIRFTDKMNAKNREREAELEAEIERLTGFLKDVLDQECRVADDDVTPLNSRALRLYANIMDHLEEAGHFKVLGRSNRVVWGHLQDGKGDEGTSAQVAE